MSRWVERSIYIRAVLISSKSHHVPAADAHVRNDGLRTMYHRTPSFPHYIRTLRILHLGGRINLVRLSRRQYRSHSLRGSDSRGNWRYGYNDIRSPTCTSRISTALRVLINIFSTILLTSSNYAMQVLCAPTRGELDLAHRGGQWLEIGLMSLNNLRHNDKKRAILWWLLTSSSVPLHLL